MAALKLIVTGDGSHSLYLREMNETYHSTHGALTESKHVFLNQGVIWHLENYPFADIKILEVGFGTGLNALMMLDFARANSAQKIEMVSLEPYPLPKHLSEQLNFADFLEGIDQQDVRGLHALQDGEHFLEANFHFHLHHKRVEETSFIDQFDVVFFDAFAPNKQAEVWEMSVLQQMFDALKINGSLVTYCAQGAFKRNLTTIGFKTQSLDGPLGKKEMVRATKHKIDS